MHLDTESDIATFIDMARHGISAAADLDEQAAYRLAHAVIDDAEYLTEPALRGFAAFAAFAHHDPEYSRSMLDTADTITA